MANTSLALDASWRDYYGMWNPRVEPWFAPLQDSACHGPQYRVIPDAQHQVMPKGGKIEYGFKLVPGSVIIGFWINDTGTAVQLTDLELNHTLFEAPVNDTLLITPGAQFGRFPSYTLLPCPWPVVGEGTFLLEAWGPASQDPTQPNTFQMVLMVAEVTDCPIR